MLLSFYCERVCGGHGAEKAPRGQYETRRGYSMDLLTCGGDTKASKLFFFFLRVSRQARGHSHPQTRLHNTNVNRSCQSTAAPLHTKSHKALKGQMFVPPLCRINEGISSCHLHSLSLSFSRAAPTRLRPSSCSACMGLKKREVNIRT